MGQTVAEKLLSRRNVSGKPVRAGDFLDARVDGVMAHTSFHRVIEHLNSAGFKKGLPRVWDPERVYVMLEHDQPPFSPRSAERNRVGREQAKQAGVKHFYDTEPGISHQMMCDYGHVRPGELIVGNDSHTTLYGALNAGGNGIGEVEMAYALLFGELWFQVPPTVRVNLMGTLPDYPVAKDVLLHLAHTYGDDFAQYRAIEYVGPVAEAMSLDSRMCLSDHGVDVGAKFAFFQADAKTKEYVQRRTNIPFEPVNPDPDADYQREIAVDVDNIGFVVAKPGHLSNGVPVEEVAGTRIDYAIIASCANGRFEDIEIAARMLKGHKVAPWVHFFVAPSSLAVYRQCLDAGFIPTLLEAGGRFLDPGCSLCHANKAYLIEGEVCITSTTRNYSGRKGSPKADVYLAGPATVTAAAIAGEITHPREVLRGL